MAGFIPVACVALFLLPIATGFNLLRSSSELEKKPLAEALGVDVDNFQWSSCGGPNDTLEVLSLSVSKDSLLTGSIHSKLDIGSPLRIEIKIEKKVLIWIPVSIKLYEDACERFALLPECPAAFLAAGLPCHCPFKADIYNFTDLELDLEMFNLFSLIPSWILKGAVRGNVKISSGSTNIACLNLSGNFV